MPLFTQHISILVLLLIIFTVILAKTHHDESNRIFSSVIIFLTMFIVLLLAINNLGITATFMFGYVVYIIYVGQKKYYDLQIRTKYIESSDLSKNFRALYASDFQFDKGPDKFNHRAMQQVVDKINQQEYDMLLLGGDYINYEENIDLFFSYLAQIKIPPLGAYAINGNHDYVDYDKVVQKFSALGIKVLDNQRYDVNDEITIVGVEDVWRGQPQLVMLDAARLNVLLTHNPDYIADLPADNDVDFALAGHYHAGQVNLLGIPLQRLLSKYVYGFYNDYQTKMYVSSGVGGLVFKGIFTLQLRYFAQPEIVEIVFIANKNQPGKKRD